MIARFVSVTAILIISVGCGESQSSVSSVPEPAVAKDLGNGPVIEEPQPGSNAGSADDKGDGAPRDEETAVSVENDEQPPSASASGEMTASDEGASDSTPSAGEQVTVKPPSEAGDARSPISPVLASDVQGETTFPAAYHVMPEWIREGPEAAVRVSFDDLDLLEIMGLDPVTMAALEAMPKRISSLDGKRIRLRGFMYPPFAPEGLTGFVLARDNEICCFGRSPKIYDLVPVELRAGETTRYIEGRPFDVVGVMHVEADADGEDLFQLFYMDDALVIE